MLIKTRVMNKYKLTQIKSYEDRIDYCNKHFGNCIGHGSGRTVFRINDTMVLKMAHNEIGLAQNKIEIDNINRTSFNKSLCACIYEKEASNTPNWLIEEYVKAADEKYFMSILGITFDMFCNILRYKVHSIEENDSFPENVAFDKLIQSKVFLQNIIEYAQNSNTFFFDLEDISNYGVKDNTIVLLDYGMTQYIYDYYWHKELKLDKNFL